MYPPISTELKKIATIKLRQRGTSLYQAGEKYYSTAGTLSRTLNTDRLVKEAFMYILSDLTGHEEKIYIPGLNESFPYSDAFLALGKYATAQCISQRQIGTLLGKNQSTISLWLSGKVDPGIDELNRLSVALGLGEIKVLPCMLSKGEECYESTCNP